MKRVFCTILTVCSIMLAACDSSASDSQPVTRAAVPEISAAPVSAPRPTPTPEVFDPDDISMQSTPDSTCFSEVGYDSDNEILAVRFRESGVRYLYYDFPASEWDSFISASSLGKYYNANIKGYYDSERTVG